MSLNQWETEDMEGKKGFWHPNYAHTQRNHTHTHTKKLERVHTAGWWQLDKKCKWLNNRTTSRLSARLRWIKFSRAAAVTPCFDMFSFGFSAEYRTANSSNRSIKRHKEFCWRNLWCSIFWKVVFFGGRCHLALIHFQCHIRLWRNLHYPKIRGGEKKKKGLGLARLRKQEFLSLSLAALDSHSLVIGHLLTVAITQDGY